MISTGEELYTFITGLNTEATVDPTLADVLVGTGQTVIEGERDWKVLKKTNTSLSASSGGTWQTAISLAAITDFSRFYGEFPIRLFDGQNRIERYRQVPWDRRLEFKDVPNTFVYDANSGTIYLNGVIPFSGSLYTNYVANATAVDLTSDGAVWSPFPARFLPVLGYYAIGIYKGAVDYDSINRQMLPSNGAAMEALKNAMVAWDDQQQLNELSFNDPTDLYGGFRNGAIDRGDEI